MVSGGPASARPLGGLADAYVVIDMYLNRLVNGMIGYFMALLFFMALITVLLIPFRTSTFSGTLSRNLFRDPLPL